MAGSGAPVRSLAGRVDGRPVLIAIDDGRICDIRSVPEAPARQITPGLVDLQVNGYRGYDVNADDLDLGTLQGLAGALAQRGTTSFVPTIITAEREKMTQLIAVIADARRRDPDLRHAIIGVHVEGPFLSEEDGARGAHAAEHLRDPNLSELNDWIRAGRGLVRFITIAPERDGAVEFIRAARAAGISVAIGHTDATPEQVAAAADAGATVSTHLGNGAPARLPRHPNLLWAQLADDRLSIGVIADGQHLSTETATVFIRAKGADRTFLVSDSAALAGSPAGTYSSPVGGTVEVTAAGRLELPGTGLLAGSGACLADCVEWATRTLPFPAPVIEKMATAIPARLAQVPDRGRIRIGAVADLRILDGGTASTIVAGRQVLGG
jgi:N-acetylglucosamine-6-phosphate deacetylase